MRPGALALAALLVLATAGAAAAQEEDDDFGRAGPYVGGGFVWAFENFDLDQVRSFSGVDVSASGSPGLDLRGGYRFNRWIAVEGNYQYYANFDIDTGDADVFDLRAFSFFASAKGYPLDGRVQPYGMFGIGVMGALLEDDYDLDIEETDASFTLRAGGGIDVYVTRHFLLNLDVAYLITTSDMNFGGPADVGTDVIPLAVTGQYRF